MRISFAETQDTHFPLHRYRGILATTWASNNPRNIHFICWTANSQELSGVLQIIFFTLAAQRRKTFIYINSCQLLRLWSTMWSPNLPFCLPFGGFGYSKLVNMWSDWLCEQSDLVVKVTENIGLTGLQSSVWFCLFACVWLIETRATYLKVWLYWVMHSENGNFLNDDSRNLLVLPCSQLIRHMLEDISTIPIDT